MKGIDCVEVLGNRLEEKRGGDSRGKMEEVDKSGAGEGGGFGSHICIAQKEL